jgi:hypothetical protein
LCLLLLGYEISAETDNIDIRHHTALYLADFATRILGGKVVLVSPDMPAFMVGIRNIVRKIAKTIDSFAYATGKKNVWINCSHKICRGRHC